MRDDCLTCSMHAVMLGGHVEATAVGYCLHLRVVYRNWGGWGCEGSRVEAARCRRAPVHGEAVYATAFGIVNLK